MSFPVLARTGFALCALLLAPFATATSSPPHQDAGLYSALRAAAPDAAPEVLQSALDALSCASAAGDVEATRLAMIDYSLPSTTPRLWVFDLPTRKLLFRELVAHGKNTGEREARYFSNRNGSLQSSLGLFRTTTSYDGANGYSLRMEGLEPGFNDQALQRAIVIHGAPYVDASLGRKQGRIGRSWGCPAVRAGIARPLIDAMKGGQLVFSYYPEQRWLTQSAFLNCAAARERRDTLAAATPASAGGAAPSRAVLSR